ncbi:MAG: hypothetical protein Q4C65_03435 [Eubacteriales bacterium]|nr:hypothetical protein [Eubacteriales bacterium]
MDRTDREWAEKYFPVFMTDEREPFEIRAVGYTVFRMDARSSSFPRRIIRADWERTELIVEYAVWFDYDIQHLYELEHVWVSVGKDGAVEKLEGSFHGKYLNQVRLDGGQPSLDENGRPLVWLQPGKHAVLPDPRLVYLVPDWRESCRELAGIDGLAVPEAFRGPLPEPDERTQERVRRYIREHFSFEPSLLFEPAKASKALLMPWERLRESIPDRLAAQLAKIERNEKE